MKIRKDFVTNSSSTNFGAASLDGIVTAITSIWGISSAMAAADAISGIPDLSDIPEGIGLNNTEGPDRDFDPESFIRSDIEYEQKIAKLDQEIKKYEKEWEEIKGTYEGDDYIKAEKEYKEYIEYLKSKKAEAETIEFERQVEQFIKEVELEYKAEWIEQRKEDLKNVREQIEFIEAVIRGYGTADYNIEEAKKQLEMYQRWEKDLDDILKKEGIEFNYQAQKREDIGPSESIGELICKVNAEYEKSLEEFKKEKINRQKKEIIKRNINAWKKEGRGYLEYSNTSDNYLKISEISQTVADVGIDALEQLTGPAGKIIKRTYVAAKGVASGVGEAWADPANATSHIIKGTVKGSADFVKELVESQNIKDAIGYTSEITQEFISSYQKGENLSTGFKTGFVKATVDTVVDRAVNKFLPDTDMDKYDYGKHSLKEIYKNIAITKKATLQSHFNDSIKKSIKNNTINQVKNLPKGEGFVFGDWMIET